MPEEVLELVSALATLVSVVTSILWRRERTRRIYVESIRPPPPSKE